MLPGTLFCVNPKCKQQIQEDTIVCEHCGADQRPPGQQSWICAKCNMENDENQRRCPSCHWTKNRPYQPPPVYSPSTLQPGSVSASYKPPRRTPPISAFAVFVVIVFIIAWFYIADLRDRQKQLEMRVDKQSKQIDELTTEVKDLIDVVNHNARAMNSRY